MVLKKKGKGISGLIQRVRDGERQTEVRICYILKIGE